jgi:hypothetical protein
VSFFFLLFQKGFTSDHGGEKPLHAADVSMYSLPVFADEASPWTRGYYILYIGLKNGAVKQLNVPSFLKI